MANIPGLNKPIYLSKDPSGNGPNNLITDEYHSTASNQPTLFKPRYGKFYKEGSHLYNLLRTGDLAELVYKTDYVFVELDVPASEESGLEVYKAVHVKTASHSGNLYFTYQAVGGADQADLALAYTVTNTVLTLNEAIEYSDIENKPGSFIPAQHKHDVADVYGFEHLVGLIDDLGTAVASANTAKLGETVAYRNSDIRNRVVDFKTKLTAAKNTLPDMIQDHVSTSRYGHRYNAARVGFGNLSNYGFTALNDQDGQPLPIYASPATITVAIANKPAKTTYPHATQTSNPHTETAANIGLGSVQNYSLLTTYTSGQYTSILSTVADPKYLSPFTLVNALQEAQANQTALYFTAPYQTRMDNVTGTITALNTQVSGAATGVTQANASISSAQAAIAAANNSVALANSANLDFELKDYNAPLASALKLILAFDYARHADGYSVGKEGIWSLPPSLDNLYLWIDADYAGNTTEQDGNIVRTTAVLDRSSYQRLFVSNTRSTAPRLIPSKDIDAGRIGITSGKVLQFNPGDRLEQISGHAVTIKPGMTIFALVRTSQANNRIVLMSDSDPVPNTGIYVQGIQNRLLDVITPNWKPLSAPNNTASPDTSYLIVASIDPYSEAKSWLASSRTVDPAHPKGTNTPASTWPAIEFQSRPMTRIGGIDPLGTDTGEIAELLIYNRRLSIAETEAVVAYLRLANSANQAFTVDYAIRNAI